MNNKFLIIVFYLLCAHYATSQNINGANNQKNLSLAESQQTFYTCAMHPQIHESKPGNCPKCGMTLVKEKLKNPKKAVVKKTITTKKGTFKNFRFTKRKISS